MSTALLSPTDRPAAAKEQVELIASPTTEKPGKRRVARAYFLVMALISLAAIITTAVLAIMYPTATVTPDPATNGAVMVTFQVLSYFTVLSNILVMTIGFMLFRNPNRTGRLFRVLHFDALIMITVTGLVFAIVLAPLTHPVGLNVLANAGLHYIAPPMFVLGWALFGPRPTFSLKLLAQSLIVPIVWVAYTLIHGAIISWYPYPFLNVMALGYATVAVNVVAIAVGALIIGAIYLGIGSLIARSKTRRALNAE